MDWTGNAEPSELVQGSDKWREWRNQGIGASDIPIIMGVSPYKNVYQLWSEKLGLIEPFKGNFITQKGNEIEPIARKMYNEKYSSNMEPELGTYKGFERLRASFDGIDHTLQRGIEIKLAGKVDFQGALLGQIPVKYMPQIQAQMLVSGYSEWDYVGYQDGEVVVVRVTTDLKMQSEIVEKAKWFWNLVETKTPPSTDETIIDDQELEALLFEYSIKMEQIKNLELSTEVLKSEIKTKCTSEKSICGQYKINWIERIGSVEYKNIPQLNGIDLEPYRKPATRYMKIEVKK